MNKYLILIFFIFLRSAPLAAQERIVSLKPNITEIIFELGLGERLVGVTTYCDYPAAAQKIDKIADYVHVEVEKVLLKKPTLVLASQENSRSNEIDFLRSRGVEVRVYPFSRLEDILNSIVQIARDLGVEARGREVVERMRSELKTLQAASNQIPGSKRLLLVVGSRPLVVVGGDNLLNDLLEELHLKNIAGDSKLRYPTFSTEQLILAKPDILVDLSMGTEQKDPAQLRAWYGQFKSVPAVQNGRLYFLDVGDFRPSPRLLHGARSLMEVFRK